MVIGLGIVLIVLGLIFALDVINIDTSAVDTATLGWILLIAGVVAVARPDPCLRSRRIELSLVDSSLTQRRASLELTAMRMRTVIAAFISTRNSTSAAALRSISCVTASTVHATMRAIRAQAW